VRDLSDGALWLAGPAGIGKSNLMASLMRSLAERAPEGTWVLPFRFRAGDDRCGRSAFLAFLRERLQASDALAPEPTGDDTAPADDGDRGETQKTPKKSPAKDALAFDPVQQVRDLLARLRPDRRVLLVLVGLDEIAERDPRFVDDVLFRLRVDRVILVAAGRAERGLPEAFRRIGAREPFPDGLPRMSHDDVLALLLLHTGPARRRLLARDVEAPDGVRNAFIARVAERSEGLPIYVNHVIGDLNAGRLDPEHPDALPAGLHAYHDELLRRAAIGDLQTITTPTLVLLALSHEPLTVAEIAALLVRSRRLETADAPLIERARRATRWRCTCTAAVCDTCSTRTA
jgi:hypothetical protein